MAAQHDDPFDFGHRTGRVRRKATVWVTIAALAAALLIGGGVAIVLTTAATPVGNTAVELLPILGTEPGPEDVYLFPVDFSGLGDGIVPDSTRLLGATPDAGYWAALGTAGEVCLIAVLLDDGASSRACRSPADFRAQGLEVNVTAQGIAAKAILLANRLVEIPATGGWQQFTENFAATEDQEGFPVTIDVPGGRITAIERSD
jgi:hypothetical protein